MSSIGPSSPPHLTSSPVPKPDIEHRQQISATAAGCYKSARRCHNHRLYLPAEQQSAPAANGPPPGGPNNDLYTQQNPGPTGYFHLFPDTSSPRPPIQRHPTDTVSPPLHASAGPSLSHSNFVHHLFPTSGTCQSFSFHPLRWIALTDPGFSSRSGRCRAGSCQDKPAETHSECGSPNQHGPWCAAPQLWDHSAALCSSRYTKFTTLLIFSNLSSKISQNSHYCMMDIFHYFLSSYRIRDSSRL